MRQQLQVSAARYKSVFPLAVHLGGYIRYGGKVNTSHHVPLHELCGRGTQCDRQGKSFTEPFKLTLAVVFLTSGLYSLSHVKRLGIPENVVLPPDAPPKMPPPNSLGGEFRFQQLVSRFR